MATRQKRERGAALLLSLFALLLLSAIGVFMYVSSDTETHIDSNYRSGVSAYYAARLGLEEVRDRIRYTSAADPSGLADNLPRDIAGNPNGVLYIVNNGSGTVNPTDPNNPSFDDQLCHDFNSGADKYSKCTVLPTVNNWSLANQASKIAPGAAASFKWARINMKTNRIADPYFVNGANGPSTLDLPICWDGVREQVSPGGLNASCDANGMQTVFMVTSLATTPGVSRNSSRRILRSEVVAPSIRPAGAVTVDAATANLPTFGNGTIPKTIVDGRNHNPDGTLPTTSRCSNVAALALDSDNARTQFQQGLLKVRTDIVTSANAACNPADGSTLSYAPAGASCNAPLWWVRGTDQTPRFGTVTIPVSSSGSGSGDHHDGHDGGSSGGSGSSSITLTGADPSTLDLSAPQLRATSAVYAPHIPTASYDPSAPAPFTGGTGNQADPALYQPPSSSVLPDAFTAMSNLVNAAKLQSNYISIPAGGMLNTSYGAPGAPVILDIQGTGGLNLQTPLTGYGVLVVQNSLQLNGGTLNWTGIVLVRSGNGQLAIQNGSGTINGAVLLQADPSTPVNLQTSSTTSGSFTINYSCDAVDTAFSALPFKVISSSEFN
ncbi:MAG TPA: hypothetical protein VHN74_07645 [Candidatus Angelobacter sp.]|nr:hypothetical protein [Candidatus Angelobacter sp.]